LLRIGKEVDDELRQRRVELAVRERQFLRRADDDPRPGNTRPGRLNERLGRVDGGDVLGTNALRERRGERPGAAADVEDALSATTPAASYISLASAGP
jgi:hypothetical protein